MENMEMSVTGSSFTNSNLNFIGINKGNIVNNNFIQTTMATTKLGGDGILNKLLFHHTEGGNFEFVEGLLETQASVNARNKDCLTPLHVSIQKGHERIFKLLLSHGADLEAISRRDICPVYTAAEYGRSEMLQHILDQDKKQISQRDGYESLPIHVAAFKGHIECLKILLSSGDDCGINKGNLFGLTPLYCAAQNNQREAVELLLKYNANVNQKKQYGYRPLHSTAVTGNTKIANVLIEGGAEIDPIAENKSTPLYLACCTGKKDIANVLIGKKANVNMKGPSGNTPLHAACECNHSEIAEILLTNEVEIDATNDNGETPIHISVSKGFVQICKLLIENNCDVDGIGPEGDTPLHSAIRSGREEIVRLLIEAGAKKDIPNSKDETASDLLKTSTLSEIELKSKGDQCLKDAPMAGESKTRIHNLENTIQDQFLENNSEQPKLNLKKYSLFEIRKLFKAIDNNNLQNFKKLVKPDYDLNLTNEFYSILSHYVIKKRNLMFLKFILDFTDRNNLHLDLNVKDRKGKTVLVLILHDAEFWFENKEEICKLALKKIIELTEDLNVQNENGETIFHLIVRYRILEILDIFTKLKFDMNIKNKKNETPFGLVLENFRFWFTNDNEVKTEFMKLIINSLTDVNSRCGRWKRTILYYASACDNVELIHVLFDKEALLNVADELGNTPLHLSLIKECLNASEALINLGADINQKDNFGRQPIHLEAYRGHVPIVDLLIRKGADVNNKDKDGDQPLHKAFREGHTEVVQLLIGKGAEINGKNNKNETPLHLSLINKCLNASEALINLGADVNQKNKEGKQPIHLAAYVGHVPIVDLLIRRGADVNNKDNHGFQPLHIAAKWGHTEVVKLLVDGGAEINGKENWNLTPLHLARLNNRVEVVEILLSKNADVKAKDSNGETPLDDIESDEIRKIYRKFNHL